VSLQQQALGSALAAALENTLLRTHVTMSGVAPASTSTESAELKILTGLKDNNFRGSFSINPALKKLAPASQNKGCETPNPRSTEPQSYDDEACRERAQAPNLTAEHSTMSGRLGPQTSWTQNLNTHPAMDASEGSIHRPPPAGGSAGDAAGLPNPRPVNTPQGESPARMTWAADQSAALVYQPLSFHPGGTGQLDPQPPSRPAS